MFKFLRKQNKEPKNLKEILEQFDALKKQFEQIAFKFEELKKDSQFSIQKIGLIRFNPFSEVGGDQSFSLALLDNNDNGLVITSFYTREGNRVYSKPIKKAESKYALSQEEKKAIVLAQKNNEKNERSKQKKSGK